MKNLNKILFLTMLLPAILFAQRSRLDALGGLSYSIIDMDSQIDPYILGNNPAWLINSQNTNRLEIDPWFDNTSGDYNRKFSSNNISNYNVDFSSIKVLGNSGTFRGFASYNYQLQKDRNQILTLSPYSGEAFFFTDTTSGDFRYSGPTFELMHSIELWNNLFIGGALSYQILDGLKKVYTFAETLYRKASFNIGFAYKFSQKTSLGINYKYYDSQERISSNDVNNTDVQTYLYRGEINKIELRGSTQNYKLKKNGSSFSAQFVFNPLTNLLIGINGEYFLSRTKSLFPQSSLIDVEDGFTNFDNVDIILQGRWIANNSLTIGFTAGYLGNNSWSKNSKNNLLIWKYKKEELFSGIGVTLQDEATDLLIGCEYEFHMTSSDSSKYIDNRFNEISSPSHLLRAGIEKAVSKKIVLRLGYNFIYKNHDFIFGGDKVFQHYLTIGSAFKISDNLEIEPRVEYSSTNITDSNLSKNAFGIFTTLRFLNF